MYDCQNNNEPDKFVRDELKFYLISLINNILIFIGNNFNLSNDKYENFFAEINENSDSYKITNILDKFFKDNFSL